MGASDNRRQNRRIAVDIPVIVTTVLDRFEATIVDLTERGAQLSGITLPEGTRFRIDYMSSTLFAQCRWAEVDRLGAQFLFQLTDGPLHDRLLVARAALAKTDQAQEQPFATSPFSSSHSKFGVRKFGQAVIGGQVGRRP
jgi:hypothetical protein